MFRDVLLQQKREFEQRQHERYVERDGSAGPDNNLIKVIVGPRRVRNSNVRT